MRTVRAGVVAGLAAQCFLLAGLMASVGLSGLAMSVGLACGVVANVGLADALTRRQRRAMGPADAVTLIRATLAGGVAALVVDGLLGATHVRVLVALCAVALVLDGIDGPIARATGTASSLGARFDMEVDAFLILALSCYDARSYGAWVLLLGAARYLYGGAGRLAPWLRAPVPPRYWRKVVAAIVGIVLTVAAAQVLPGYANVLVLVIALLLLGESFGRDVWWLARDNGLAERTIRRGRGRADSVHVRTADRPPLSVAATGRGVRRAG